MTDHPTQMWTEDELDAALTALHSDVPADDDVLATARSRLLAAAGAPDQATTSTGKQAASQGKARRKRIHWLAVAAAVVLVAAGGVVISQTTGTGGGGGGGREGTDLPAAAKVLQRAAVNVAADKPLDAGQYRYFKSRSWGAGVSSNDRLAPGKTFVWLEESIEELWIPKVETDEWLKRQHRTGKEKWIVGTAAEGKAAEMGAGKASREQYKAPCGGEEQSAGRCKGGWPNPTPAWVANLPRDSGKMLAALRAEAKRAGDPFHGSRDAQAVMRVGQMLDRGPVPAGVRAAIYNALAQMPGIEITEKQVNLDGRTGTAFGVPGGKLRIDVIVDPETGEYLGQRGVLTKKEWGVKPGTVMNHTAVTTGVVDKMGQRPT